MYSKRKSRVTQAVKSKLPDIRLWLEDMYARGELEIHQNRVMRKQLMERFGIQQIDCLAIQDVLEEFDQRVVDGYLPTRVLDKLAKLQSVLQSDACPIELPRGLVNIRKVADLTGIDRAYLKTAPLYRKLIDEKSEQIQLTLRRSSLTLELGRIFLFGDLVPNLPVVFVEKVVDVFEQTYGSTSASTIKQRYNNVKSVLSYMAHQDDAHCVAVRESLRLGTLPTAKNWSEATENYCNQRLSRSDLSSGIAGAQHIRAIERFFGCLTRSNIVPPLLDPLSTRKSQHRTKHRKSVAETGLRLANTKQSTDAAYFEFARSTLIRASEMYGVEVDGSEEFLVSVAAEAAICGVQENASLPEVILTILDRRLSAIRDHAVAIFDRWQAHFSKGPGLLEQAVVDPETYYSIYCAKDSSIARRRTWVRDHFSIDATVGNTETGASMSLSNLLTIIAAHFNGVAPSSYDERALDEAGQFFRRRYMENGGIDYVSAYLSPHREAYCAALTLYLCDSGANVSVGRTLSADCIQPSDLRNFVTITGHKARANGKPIFCELDLASHAVKALMWIREAGSKVRQLANEKEQGFLFVRRDRTRYQLLAPQTYTDWFKEFVAGIPSLCGLDLVPSMLRPSVLLKAALERNGRVQAGIAIGQHSEQVTIGYQVKLPTRLLYDAHIQKFQRSLESIVLSNVGGAAARMGISVDEFRDRIDVVGATGFGTFCANKLGRPRNEGKVCSSIDCWNDCPQMVLVAEVDAVITLQLWQRALRLAQPDWERDHPDRWDRVWLPWLCLIDVVEEKMSRGPLVRIWAEASLRRSAIEEAADFVAPRPW